MAFVAASVLSKDSSSAGAVGAALARLDEQIGDAVLRVVVVYLSVNHDQAAVLKTLRDRLPEGVKMFGCSVQGVTVQGELEEGPYVLGLMGLAGDELEVGVACAGEIQEDTRNKGEDLGKRAKRALTGDAKVGLVIWDPLSGADAEQMLAGIRRQISAPLVGGGAGQPWGKLVKTFQYFDDEVVQHGAILCLLGGPFEVLVGVCHGTSPTGVAMTLTKAEGNALIEFDGRPALDVWREAVGCTVAEIQDQDFVSTWALGIQRRFERNDGTEDEAYLIRAAYGFDVERGAAIVAAAIPEGTQIMLHHRTVDAVVEGTREMARELQARLGGRRAWAAFGFECGARTYPFLGLEEAGQENRELQDAVAPGVPWLGMSAWGEIAPVGGEPAFHNCTYPLVLLV